MVKLYVLLFVICTYNDLNHCRVSSTAEAFASKEECEASLQHNVRRAVDLNFESLAFCQEVDLTPENTEPAIDSGDLSEK